MSAIHKPCVIEDSSIWALFLVAEIDIYASSKPEQYFRTFALRKNQHPVWHPNARFTELVRSGNDQHWHDFCQSVEKFQKLADILPFGFNEKSADYFFELMFKKVAISALKKIQVTNIIHPSPLVSPNTTQAIPLKPQHPGGLHLFCAFDGETYEEAINSSLLFANHSGAENEE